MAKTFSELQALALQIRDEIFEKKNTAPRVGAALLDIIDNTIQNITDINQKLSVFEHACSGFKRVQSESQLPVTPSEDEKSVGYLVGKNLYLYVGKDGNSVNGRYFNVGDITGPQGEPGPQGLKGVDGKEGDRGPQGNSGITGSTSDIDVINDLSGGESTPGSIKVLAAEQGKVLYDKICEVGSKSNIFRNLKKTKSTKSSITGYYFSEGYQNVFRGSNISSIDINIVSQGTISILVGRNVLESNFEYDIIQTFDVVTGFNTLILDNPINLGSNEWLGIYTGSDTSEFSFYSGSGMGVMNISDNFIYLNDASKMWIRNKGFLDAKIWFDSVGISTMNKEITDIRDELNNPNRPGGILAFRPKVFSEDSISEYETKSGFYPVEKWQKMLRGRTINGLYLNIAVKGTLSILKSKGVGTTSAAEFVPVISETLTINKTGLQFIELKNPIILNSDEWLGLKIKTDTARIYYNYDLPDGSGINFTAIKSDNSDWFETTTQDLCIGVSLISAEQIINNTNGLNGKTISIIGDSISTYDGYIPEGNETYYPRYGIDNVNKTWWKMLIDELGLNLIVNQSWSGSRITNVSNGTRIPFIDESRLGSLGSPDIIIVEGGLNDYWQSSPSSLGEFIKETNPATFDKSVFRQAYQYLCYELQKRYPASDIFICVPSQTNKYGLFSNNPVGWSLLDLHNTVRECADFYGLKVIDLSKCGINQQTMDIYTGDGIHPNDKGAVIFKEYVKKCLINNYSH